jgi:NADH-quinone oxidoreductase subunit L
MTRLMLMTFFGKPRWEDGVHPHESPAVMTLPMVVLAVGSVAAGFVLVQVAPLADWLAPVFGEPEEAAAHVVPPLVVSVLVTLVVAAGALVAWLAVGRREVPTTAPARVSLPVRAARNALWADAVNEAVFMRPGMRLTRGLRWVDDRGVDGLVNGIGTGLGGSSTRLGRAQTGFVRSYALGMLGGAVLVVGALVAVAAG